MEPGESRSLCVWSTAVDVRRAARFCRDALQGVFPAREIDKLELAVVEAGNNIVEHAYKGRRDGRIWVSLLCFCDRIEIHLEDEAGAPFDPVPRAVPANIQRIENVPERGWGLFLITSIMDDVRFESTPGRGRLVLIKKRARPCAEGADAEDLQPPLRPNPAADETIARLRRLLRESEDTLAEMTAELNTAYETLSVLFSLNRELDAFGSEEVLRRNLLYRAVESVGARWGVMRVLRGRDLVLAAYTRETPLRERAPRIRLASSEDGGPVLDESTEFLADGVPVMRIPLRGHRRPIGRLDLGGRLETAGASEFLSSELKLARALADHAAVILENRRLHEEAVRLEVARHEVEVARKLQQRLHPESLPSVEGVNLSLYIETAHDVGGDYVGFAQPDPQRLLFVVADVMGKGMSAAFLSAMVHSAFCAAVGSRLRPAAVLREMNRILFGDLERLESYVTVLVGLVDVALGRFAYASAGHCPVLLQVGSGPVRMLADGDVMLGVEKDPDIREYQAGLPPGTRLFAYTDGLTDIVGENGIRLGIEPVVGLLEQLRARPVEEAAQALVRHATAHAHGELQDDVAVLGLEMVGVQ